MGLASSLAAEEESKECSTPPVTRILPRNFDPRSPSEEIVRTPIEVVCSKRNHDPEAQGSPLLFNTPRSRKSRTSLTDAIAVKSDDKRHADFTDTNATKEATNSNDELVCDSDLDLKLDNPTTVTQNSSDISSVSETTDNISDCSKNNRQSKKQLVYLETDIDAIEDNFPSNFPIEHPRVRQLRKGQVQTLVSNENNTATSTVDDILDTDSLSAKIDSLSFTDVSFDDPSLLVSDNENEVFNDRHDPTADINEWLITIEDDSHSLLPFDIPIDKEESVSVQKQCITPDRKIKSSKERTPLGSMVQNKAFDPVKESNNLKKQWRGIEEERARRGISLTDENTPPQQPPPFDKISSAPGKLMKYRRNIDWDRESATMHI